MCVCVCVWGYIYHLEEWGNIRQYCMYPNPYFKFRNEYSGPKQGFMDFYFFFFLGPEGGGLVRDGNAAQMNH